MESGVEEMRVLTLLVVAVVAQFYGGLDKEKKLFNYFKRLFKMVVLALLISQIIIFILGDNYFAQLRIKDLSIQLAIILILAVGVIPSLIRWKLFTKKKVDN